MLTTLVLDVGETLVDETPHWQAWADWLDVPAFTLFGVLGGLVARGRDHRDVVGIVRPGTDFATERAAKDAATEPPPLRLYDDVLPCLRALRDDGWQVVVGGNQPVSFSALVAALALPVDVVTSSGELGAAKPDRAFYEAVAARAGVPPQQCVSVGDRVDNDVVGATAAGMAAVHLRRGPWALLGDAPPPGTPSVPGLAALPGVLRALRGQDAR